MTRQIQDVPADVRIPVAVAERQLNEARQTATHIDKARDTSKKKADDLSTAANGFRKWIDSIAVAEKQAALHRKLDDLLDKGGLPRERVRSAERETVRLAKDTLQNLSEGGLTVEREDSTEDDEAFALRVRQADKPAPTGVNYLSGSEKFLGNPPNSLRIAEKVSLRSLQYQLGGATNIPMYCHTDSSVVKEKEEGVGPLVMG